MAKVFTALFVALSLSSAAHALTFVTDQVINIDFNGVGVGDNTYVGLGALSSPGGTNWNGFGNTEATTGPLNDEFGTPTGVQAFRTNGTDAFSQGNNNNDLQNYGWGSNSWKITGLVLGQSYETAWYLGLNTGVFFGIDHGGVTDFVVTPNNPTYNMPGTLGSDYGLLTVIAKDLGGGEVGFAIDGNGVDGSVLGLQISGVPEPTTLALIGFGGLVLLRRRH